MINFLVTPHQAIQSYTSRHERQIMVDTERRERIRGRVTNNKRSMKGNVEEGEMMKRGKGE